MSMHIPHYDNRNAAIVGRDDADVPLAYFNIVRLKRGESFISDVPGYETCLVPAHGSIDVEVRGEGLPTSRFEAVGGRASIWEGQPAAVYVPVVCSATFVCRSESTETFVAGARFGHGVALRGQSRAQDAPNLWLVVNNKNLG